VPGNDSGHFIVDISESDESISLTIDDERMLPPRGGDPTTSFQLPKTFQPGSLHKINLRYADISGNAGVQLSWKTETTPKEIIPGNSFFTNTAIDVFKRNCFLYHRAALFIKTFQLTANEIALLKQNHESFSHIDFKALSFEHWK